MVDDFGRYDAELRLLKSHAFPFGDPTGKEISLKSLQTWCEELDASDLCDFYQTPDGKRYVQVTRWQERSRSPKSKYPSVSEECVHFLRNPALSCQILPPSSSSSPSPLHPRPNVIASTQLRWSEAEGWSGNGEELISELKTAYPACDIERQFLEMAQWLKANPAKAKKSNWRRFVDNWLRRKQDRGGDVHGSNGTSKPRVLSFAERDRRIGQVRERRNVLFKAKTDRRTGAVREFTLAEQTEYEALTKELKELDVCFSG